MYSIKKANDNNFPESANIIKTMCIANEIKGNFKYIQSVSILKSEKLWFYFLHIMWFIHCGLGDGLFFWNDIQEFIIGHAENHLPLLLFNYFSSFSLSGVTRMPSWGGQTTGKGILKEFKFFKWFFVILNAETLPHKSNTDDK